jgi:cyclophilin family peptidyl-prolyl cis-trans isomerase
MPSRARERDLAKQRERRQAERDSKRRRRRTVSLWVIGLPVAAIALYFGVKAQGNSSAAPPSSSVSTTLPTPTPTHAPGTITGTVTPNAAPKTVACGATAPKLAGKPKPQFAGPPPMNIDPNKTYTATFKTSCGTFVIQLDAKQAPQTVNSFVFLADHHFFDGQYFTRLDASIDVVQGGDPTGTGTGGPGYSIPDEVKPGTKYPTGSLAMAKSAQPNSGGSQFFLITGPKGNNLNSNAQYTVFGKIVSGLAVAQEIQALPVKNPRQAKRGDMASQAPKDAVYMDSVTIAVSG